MEEEHLSVFDLDFSLNTEDLYQDSAASPIINGFLDSLIIRSNKKCHIRITFVEIPGLIVYDDMEFDGTKLIPLRLQTVDPENQLLLLGFTRLALNNALKITISGSSFTSVDITLRLTYA